MKKIIFTIVAAMCMLSVSAQDANTQKGERKHMDPKEMVEKRTQEMTKKYSLSAEQAAKVKALNEKYMGKRGDKDGKQMKNGERPAPPKDNAGKKMGNGNGPRRGHRPDMTAYNNELKSIMTDAQYKAYTADMEKRKAERKNRQKQN